MLSKPAFRARKHAETFKEARVVEDYRHRPTYPESLFVRLAELIDPDSRAVLDVGTGPGDVARPLSLHVDRIDAVDFSEHMLQKARALPHGDRTNIRWIRSDVESTTYDTPYGLITTVACLHWFDLNIALPRFRDLLRQPAICRLVLERVAVALLHTIRRVRIPEI